MRLSGTAAGFMAAAALIAAPLSSASAHGYYHRDTGLGGAVGAVVVGAATIVSAPFVLLGIAPGPRYERPYGHYRRARGNDESAYYAPPRAAYRQPAPAPAYYGPPPPRQAYSTRAANYEAPCDTPPGPPDYRPSRQAAWNGYGY